MERINAIIKENLRLVMTNVHIRYEDVNLSRRDQAFLFGITFDHLSYHMTNNKFEAEFLNIDDKKQEQKSFSMLEVKKLGLYWNSNAKE